MEHFIKKLLLPLIALVVSAAPGLAQMTVYHGATAADAASIVTNGIQQFNNFVANAPGAGLYVTTDYQVALRYANQAAQNAQAAGLTGPAAQPYVLEMVVTDGATVGNFVMRPGFSNIGAGIIGSGASWEPEVQTALNQVDIVNVVDAGYVGAGGETSFMVLHSSAEAYVGVANPVAADLSVMPSASYVGQAQQMAQRALSQAENIIVGNASALNSDAVQVMENTGQMTAQVVNNCSWYCGVAAALSAKVNDLKIGLEMGASSAGMGSVMSAGAIYGSVMLCDNTLDNLCSGSINTSLSFLLFGSTDTGPTLISQTFNPYTGSTQRDYSDGSTVWNWNNGIVSGIENGIGWVRDPVTGVIGSLTPLDGQDVKSSQILQVNFLGQIQYLTQAGFSLTLDDAQTAVASTNALNSLSVKVPGLFQVSAVVPVLDPYGKPTPAAPPDQSGTSTTNGTTSKGNPYTTTVQKDSGGNIVAEYTVTTGTNFTTSQDDLTGTSQTIQRNPDGSTTIFNCIQKQTVCASSNGGIVNYDDGWNGNNPYDASNQSFQISFPGYSGPVGVPGGGGGGGSGPPSLVPPGSVVGPGGCDEFGC